MENEYFGPNFAYNTCISFCQRGRGGGGGGGGGGGANDTMRDACRDAERNTMERSRKLALMNERAKFRRRRRSICGPVFGIT